MKALLLAIVLGSIVIAGVVLAGAAGAVALPRAPVAQQAPEDPHDSAPWICDVKADPRNDVRPCACQLLCSTGEDGAQHTQESSVCRRYCVRDHCACHMEETCKAERLR